MELKKTRLSLLSDKNRPFSTKSTACVSLLESTLPELLILSINMGEHPVYSKFSKKEKNGHVCTDNHEKWDHDKIKVHA